MLQVDLATTGLALMGFYPSLGRVARSCFIYSLGHSALNTRLDLTHLNIVPRCLLCGVQRTKILLPS